MKDKYGRYFYAVTATNLKGTWHIRAKTPEEAVRLFRSNLFPKATGISAIQVTEDQAFKNPRNQDKLFQKYLSAMSRSMVKGHKPKTWNEFKKEHSIARRKQSKNPRLQNMFMLLATKGKTVLKYTGGIRFSSKGRAVLFASRHDAETAARDLRSRFPILKGYTLHVRS